MCWAPTPSGPAVAVAVFDTELPPGPLAEALEAIVVVGGVDQHIGGGIFSPQQAGSGYWDEIRLTLEDNQFGRYLAHVNRSSDIVAITVGKRLRN